MDGGRKGKKRWMEKGRKGKEGKDGGRNELKKGRKIKENEWRKEEI